jgi:hypothetical protein
MPVNNLDALREKPKGLLLKSCRLLISRLLLLFAPKVRKIGFKCSATAVANLMDAPIIYACYRVIKDHRRGRRHRFVPGDFSG